MLKKGMYVVLIVLIGLGVLSSGCQAPASSAGDGVRPANELILATTTSTDDSGLLSYILPLFEAESGIRVKVVSLGTGQALELGKNGDADAVLVHAKSTELEMVEQGHFVNRRDVMYNDFIIVGPESDPAELNGITDIGQAFAAVAEAKSPFISRSDDSGTHKKELALWANAGIIPEGKWYVRTGSGMGTTLRMADEMQGYTLTDRATYLSMRDNVELVILFEGSEFLYNQYGIMAVNPANYPGIHYEGATRLIDYLTSPAGQEQIAAFRPYGETLFFPNAVEKGTL